MSTQSQSSTDDTTDEPTDDYAVPAGETPERCGYCDAPFADADLLALHRGIEHADGLSADERESFEAVYADEQEEIRLFRLKALGLLVLLYFGLLIAYSLFA